MAFNTLVSWYKRYERPISSISLIGGFVFDALTLKRVDLFWENLWVIVHLLVVAAAILLLNRPRQDGSEQEVELHFWLVNILQFTFGGLFSTFLVFYFRSAVLSTSWPFLLLLVFAFIANERLKEHYTRITFQVGLFYLSLFSFTIFLMPVLLHRLGPWVFILSGLLGILLVYVFVRILRRVMKTEFRRVRRRVRLTVFGIFVAVNVLYFTDLIPPLPLSLKDAGIYREVHKVGTEYVFAGEETDWRDIFTLYDPVFVGRGAKVFAYTAIFSPGNFSTGIVHEWQSEEGGKWVTQARVPLQITGGREGGFRTYSELLVMPGKWRVNVLTPSGQVLGRLRFLVLESTS